MEFYSKLQLVLLVDKELGLIDSGASRCYMSPETAALCELELNPEILHLELANGSKVQSTQKAENVNVNVGKSICRVDFTVTKLLKDVDLVLGVNWLISLESCHQLERTAYAYLDRKRMEQGPGNSVTF